MPDPVLIDWHNTNFYMMLPKRLGQGYLKMPYGHHVNDHMEDTMDRIEWRGGGRYCMFGNDLPFILILDGVPFRDWKSNSHTEMLHIIGEEFARTFDTEWRECSDVLDRSMGLSSISRE